MTAPGRSAAGGSKVPPDPIVRCHECRTVLGRTTRDDRRRNLQPVIDAMPGVRLFIDFRRQEAGLLCPNCGAFGRTFRIDRIRGIVLGPDRSLEVA